jgi:signal transduction histidine kinase/ligand-binding sensor domain-containing protein/DNA-binding response OmpR family regulator
LFGISNRLNAFAYKFIKCLLLLLFSTFFTVHAQSNENTFEKVNIEIDGETVFDVYIITQDHQGYMWMATNLGLIRYNGLEGKKYDIKRSDSSSNSIDFIWHLYVDYLGDIWIGANSGLSKYNPDCDCLYQYPFKIDDINLREIQSITEDKNNNLYLGIWHDGLLRYERESDSFTRILHKSSDSPLIIDDFIGHLLVDQINNLWIGTGSGLVRYNINTGNIKKFAHDPSDPNSLADNRITALYNDTQGQLLIGTVKSGFHIYDPKNESLNRISFNPNNPNQLYAPYTKDKVSSKSSSVQIIHQDQNGGYWIGTKGKGINHFNARAKTFKNYDFNLDIPQVLRSFYEDRQGNLWAGGVMGSGLFRMDLFAQKYHLNTNFPHATRTYESSINPGVLWVGSHETGLSKLDLKTNNIIRYLHNDGNNKSIGHNWVRSIYQENKRTLWLGIGNGYEFGGHLGNGGVDRMDIETGLFTHFKLTRNDDGDDDFSYTPFSICEDKEGYLWLGAGPGGIFRSDKDKKEFKHFKILKNDNLLKDVIFNIVRMDSNGNIWASDFAGEGTLYLYDRQENKFSPYLNGFKMYNLIVDDKGWLLISTWEKGLVHLNPADRSYIQYTKKEGLPSNDGVDIVKGENGMYWINTRIGPAKFNTKTGEISSIGLPKRRYNTGVFKASNNHIYVGSNNGIYSFNINQAGGNPYPPQVSISDLLISEKNYLTSKNESIKLKLAYNQNDISFKYVGLHFSNPKKNTYQYKLDPLDDNWINVDSERTVRFANLSPGTYNFQVKASNSDGVWSSKPDNVKFTITKSWWTTWWAYAIYISILSYLAYKIYRFQLSRRIVDSERNRLKEVNHLKNTLYTNITHEFRTPLTVIKGMADSLKFDLQNNKHDELENSIDMIERNSDSLLHLVNEMLDLSKIESGNMELQLVQSDVIPFLKYLNESFSSLAEENLISLTIYSEIDSLVMDFDSKKLTSIISNILSNAIKFTPEYGKIIVHINKITQKEETFLLIKIKDNGIGISSENLPHIFNRFYQTDTSTIRKHEGTGIGLALTKELVALMNGTIEAKSTLEKGSEFSVMIPITREATVISKVEIDTITIAPKITIPSKKIKKSIKTNSELPLVLIIEDNIDVAHYLKTCLTNTYETIHAVNGIVGIEMALEKIPDIIICDVMMPGKDGFEVCETLKSDERSDHIPIIILTAKVTTEDRLTGLSCGADAYLAKPFNKEELFTRLDQLVLLRKKLIHKIQNDGFKTILKKNTKNPKLQFLQKVITLIHEDLNNSNFGSEDLAKELHISESQLYRKIKAITEKSTAVFIRSIRLQYAKELLSTHDKSVSEIAYEVGFNDPSWFSRAFKEEFGISPSEVTK